MADLQTTLYYRRRRRRLRYSRVGLGLAYATIPPGLDNESPISVIQGQAAGSLIAKFECLGGVTTGTLLFNVRQTISLTATEVRLQIPEGSIDVSATHDLPASGFHTIVGAYDPPNSRAKIYVDGRLVIDATGTYTSWGRSGPSFLWDYADGMSNVGQIRDLETFVEGDIPAIF